MINVPPVTIKTLTVTGSGTVFGRSQSQLYRPSLIGGSGVIRELPICVNAKMPYVFKARVAMDASDFTVQVMDPFMTPLLEWQFETFGEIEP